MVEEREVGDFGGGLLDCLAQLGVFAGRFSSGRALRAVCRITESESHVHGRRSALENAECANDGRRHAIVRLVDLEVLQRALGLSTPVSVGGDLKLAKCIALCSCCLSAVSANSMDLS